MTDPETCEAPDRAPKKPAFQLPDGATDCHAHVFNPAGLSPVDPQRSYSPSIATETQYNELHNILGIDRGVIVQPSVYGTDNRTTMAVVARYPERLRAIVVVEQSVDKDTLLQLHKQGARGVRMNLLFGSSAVFDNVQQLAHTVKSLDLDWHLQVLTDVSTHEDVYHFFKQLDIDVVFDHMGHSPSREGLDNPGFQGMLKLLEENRCWVKLSGAYRISQTGKYPYPDVDEIAQSLVACNPDRLVWGSDWPHPLFNGEMPNDGDLLNDLERWVPDTAVRNRILVDNAALLYGY